MYRHDLLPAAAGIEGCRRRRRFRRMRRDGRLFASRPVMPWFHEQSLHAMFARNTQPNCSVLRALALASAATDFVIAVCKRCQVAHYGVDCFNADMP